MCGVWSHSTCCFALPRRSDRLPPYRPVQVYKGSGIVIPPTTNSNVFPTSTHSNSRTATVLSMNGHPEGAKISKLWRTYPIPTAHSLCSHHHGYIVPNKESPVKLFDVIVLAEILDGNSPSTKRTLPYTCSYTKSLTRLPAGEPTRIETLKTIVWDGTKSCTFQIRLQYAPDFILH